MHSRRIQELGAGLNPQEPQDLGSELAIRTLLRALRACVHSRRIQELGAGLNPQEPQDLGSELAIRALLLRISGHGATAYYGATPHPKPRLRRITAHYGALRRITAHYGASTARACQVAGACGSVAFCGVL